MTLETFGRRQFGAMVVGGAAAAAVASPVLAQRDAAMRAPSIASLTAGNWMQQVQAQHREVDRHFAMLKQTGPRQGAMRDAQLKMLATVLTGHSIAEEVALYPGLAMIGDVGASDKLYMEQQHAKVMIAQIDAMPRQGPQFMDRLMTLETAIKAHVTDEEGNQYPKLMRQATAAQNAKMTADFRREFTRYMA